METVIPPECRAAADDLAQAQDDLAGAYEEMLAARSTDERQQAAAAIKAAQARVDQSRAALNTCLGCPEPVTEWYEDSGFSVAVSSDPRIGSGVINITSAPPPDSRTLSFTLSGCDHQSVVPALGEAIWDPFGLFSFTVPRQFPDFFTRFFPPALTTMPYTVSVSPIGTIHAQTGSYDRDTGELDLWCAATVGWSAFGAPPAWLHGLYGLDFSQSHYSGLFTTGSVPKTVAPTGPMLTGMPLDRGTGRIGLVAAGTLSGGFGNGVRVEFTLSGSLNGPPPVGPR